MENVVVMGAGSWGTALAVALAKNGHKVKLWEFDKEKADKISKLRENPDFLKGIKFPENLEIINSIDNLLIDIKYLVLSVPSQVLRGVVKQISNQLRDDIIIINTGKGIELNTGKRLSEVIKDEILGKFHKNIVVLSGPTHAEEVGAELPSAIVAAGEEDSALKVQQLFSSNYLRVYTNSDIIGVELGGAVKNCMAVTAGIADGLGYGDNTKAALITRGLAEMSRFGKEQGAKTETFSGLAGMGDLIVTCASKHSRNRYVGERIGKGEKLEDILSSMHMVAEGIPTIKAIKEKVADLENIMPILDATYKIIYEGKPIKEMIGLLMGRDLKVEFY